jgi:hypothetical protein
MHAISANYHVRAPGGAKGTRSQWDRVIVRSVPAADIRCIGSRPIPSGPQAPNSLAFTDVRTHPTIDRSGIVSVNP